MSIFPNLFILVFNTAYGLLLIWLLPKGVSYISAEGERYVLWGLGVLWAIVCVRGFFVRMTGAPLSHHRG